MKNHLLRGTLSLLVAIILCIGICGTGMAADKPIKLLYATFDPPMGPWAGAMKNWAKDIETRTNGRVKVEMSWAGALGKGPELFNVVRKGVADAVNLQPGLVPGLFPMSDFISLPWIIDTGEIGGKALLEFRKRGYLDKEYKDVIILILYTGTGDPIFTKNKPVRTLNDLSGMKLFAAGPASQKRIKLMGGVPTMLSSAMDLLPGLQKNVIDGIVLPFPIVNALMLFKQVKYVTEPGVGTIPVSIVMNKDYYNKLPADIQKILLDMTYEHSMNFAKGFDKFLEMSKEHFDKGGGQVVQWNADTMIELEKLYAKIWKDWIDEKEAMGLPARKAIDDFYYILKDLGVENPTIGYRPGK
jgi:TRAP-type C4-dicarboxylate transport system substrate-binding protein